MFLFRKISPTLIVISVAIIASAANTIITRYLPIGGTYWLAAAQTIVALFMTVIVLRFRDLIIVAAILFVVPTTLTAIIEPNSHIGIMEEAFLATAATGMVFIGHFVEQKRRTIFLLSQDLQHIATHDALTDLPNRVMLRERINDMLKQIRRGKSVALLYLDLDGFKDVNDTFGHAIGDQLLKIVSQRLRSCVREPDMVARLGGDEFAIIIQTSENQPEDATALAERICEVIGAPYELGQNEVVVEMSIGVTVGPKDGGDYEQLLKNADIALYRAKKDSRGTYCLFEPEMEVGVATRHVLALDLRKALGGDQLELYYQPLVDLQDNKICGFEALLRWHHPERGTISPSEFIPIAEQTGLINQIGEWVIHQACAEAANWPDDIKVAVNVSPIQFRRGNILQIVKNALATTNLPADRLELEVTESVLLRDEEAILAMLYQLHDLGAKISLDDFGTGYSSLSYLQSFPFDKIKIDASFLNDLSKGEDGIGIVQAVISLASRLGATTVAEGIESEELLDIVRKEGCTQVQGYFLSRPLPAKDILFILPRPLNKNVERVA